jgi:hypothetical protein
VDEVAVTQRATTKKKSRLAPAFLSCGDQRPTSPRTTKTGYTGTSSAVDTKAACVWRGWHTHKGDRPVPDLLPNREVDQGLLAGTSTVMRGKRGPAAGRPLDID